MDKIKYKIIAQYQNKTYQALHKLSISSAHKGSSRLGLHLSHMLGIQVWKTPSWKSC